MPTIDRSPRDESIRISDHADGGRGSGQLLATDRAMRALERERAAQAVDIGSCLRLLPTAGALVGMTTGVPAPGDVVINVDDAPLLYVAAESAALIAGRVLDYAGPPVSAGFLLRQREGR